MDDQPLSDAADHRSPSFAADDGGAAAAVARPSHRNRWFVLAGAVALAVVLWVFTDVPGGTIIGAIVLGLVIMRVGWFFLQQFATPPPPPPDPGTLRRVRLVFRCPVCGTEVRMTSAATADPEPPRHCMEEMDLISSGDD